MGRKISFVTEGNTSTASLGEGTAQVVVGDRVLALLAAGPNEDAVAIVAHVLGSHLERFGQRSELAVRWTHGTDRDTR